MIGIKFSIITPIYNRENHVQHLVQSVQNQTYDNWELILVDDGSTDHTGERCLKFAKEDSRIQYTHKQNGGVCTARNRGIDCATGDYILFLDSDSTLLSHALSILASEINHYPQADFLCFGYHSGSGNWLPCGVEKSTIVLREDIRKNYLPAHLNIISQEHFFLKNFVWNKCYKREFLHKHNLRFDENRRTWEDGQFVVNCLDCANALLIIQEALQDDSCPFNCEHLSARLFEDQIQNYIADEKEYYRRFCEELDFKSARYCRSNFDVLNMLFERSVHVYKKKARSVIGRAIDEELVVYWAENTLPSNMYEKKIRNCIIDRNANELYHLYRLRQLKGAVKQVFLRLVKG